MRPAIEIAVAARRDLDERTLWLRREVDSETAQRFARAAIATFHRLAGAPGTGSPVESAHRSLSDLRKGGIDGFPRTLAFYIPMPGGVRIIRVLHAAQDWVTLLEP